MEDAYEQQPVAAAEPNTDREVDPKRKNLSKEWVDRILSARKHKRNADAYKQMRKNQSFAAHGAGHRAH